MAITIVKLQNDNVEIIRSAKKKRSLQAVAAVYIEDERVFITDCCNLSDDFNAVEVTSVTRKDGTVVPIGGDSELLYNELKEYFFFNIIGSSITNYVGEFNNYTDLTTSVPAGTAGRFAFVLNSQGTKWLPGSLGGTFYGAGWYYDTGSQWSNKNDEIYEGLEDLINDKVNRFSIDLDSSESSVTRTVAGGRTTFTITHDFDSLDVIAQVYRISNSRDVGWRIQRNGVNELEASRAGTIADGDFRIVILN